MGTTTNYSWIYPTVNADSDTWGTEINNMAIAIDASLKTVDNSTAAAALKANNLSDLASAATARTNLGLGTAATQNITQAGLTVAGVGSFATDHVVKYDSNGSLIDSGYGYNQVMLVSLNLAGLTSLPTARTNLGLGSIATHNVTISSSAPSGGSDGDIWFQYA